MVIGGDFGKSTFIYDWALETWTEGPELNEGRRFDLGCGYIKDQKTNVRYLIRKIRNPRGISSSFKKTLHGCRYLLISGGWDATYLASTEILDLTQEQSTWMKMPSLELPFGLRGHQVFSDEANRQTYIIGGRDIRNKRHDTFVKMELENLVGKVEVISTKLEVGREDFLAFPLLINSPLINCD